MSAAIDTLNPDQPKHVAIVASNPAMSKQTGWAIGFWWSELTHSYWDSLNTVTRSRSSVRTAASWKRIPEVTLGMRASMPLMT